MSETAIDAVAPTSESAGGAGGAGRYTTDRVALLRTAIVPTLWWSDLSAEDSISTEADAVVDWESSRMVYISRGLAPAP